ncbi:MAG: two component, sigma54 specific, transcriptional regulator, Fis family [Candidatus Peribacteria bacterium]|nr:two component, sigma54 specific, transcriptional regulator, Fis family [Candidatus Peribacteria bacterium]
MTKTVIVAEDEPFLSIIINVELKERGIHSVKARDGEQAIEEIEKHLPDLLLLDLRMPKIDGFGVLEHIRTKGYTFPVIVFSNISDQVEIDKAKDLGVKDYIVKSNIDWDEIGLVVEKYLK